MTCHSRRTGEIVDHELMNIDVHLFVCKESNVLFSVRNSCGLFVIECLEHWDGDGMTGYFNQVGY
jgi:hypothetical protein